MPKNSMKIPLGPPVRGMNTYNNPKALAPGEVVKLVNARPGNPPEARKGMDGYVLDNSTNWEFYPPGEAFYPGDASSPKYYAVCWVRTDTPLTGYYSLIAVPEDTDGTDVVTLGTCLFPSVPIFSMTRMHGCLYIFAQPYMTLWNTSSARGHKVVESNLTSVRDAAIDEAPEPFGVASAGIVGDNVNGEFSDGDNFQYAYTYVRRTDSAAFEAGTTPTGMILPPGITNSQPKAITTYLPGAVESIEDSDQRQVLTVSTYGGFTAFYAQLSAFQSGNHESAIQKGATHLRIFRTRRSSGATRVTGLENYHLVDLPLGRVDDVAFNGATNVDAATDEITVSGHGWSTAQEVVLWEGVGATAPVGLSDQTRYYVIVVDGNTIQLASTVANAQASTAINITSVGSGTIYLVPSWQDQVSDDTQSLESNYLTMDQYTGPLETEYVEYVKSRLWLFKDGVGYYSEAPGGDGGTDNDLALAYPQKYASMFKPLTYRIDFESMDGSGSRGIARLGDDLFFFKENKIYALYGGDPNSASRTEVSPSIGCAFPYTITKADAAGYFGSCILFISNEGPMVITEGGRMRPFTEFKIKELWPDKSDELFGDLDDNWDHIKNHCTARWHRHEWHVMYENSSGVVKHFVYFFNPEKEKDPDAPYGPYQVKFAEAS
jgi:hypothetical protein